ncbi:uncharacterized protein [Dendrobates tinctorius]|uniref:uncharacterized protein n=1 Tax=Dendrobates tinctorius TaxID=92724 RepID=UPI003CC97640
MPWNAFTGREGGNWAWPLQPEVAAPAAAAALSLHSVREERCCTVEECWTPIMETSRLSGSMQRGPALEQEGRKEYAGISQEWSRALGKDKGEAIWCDQGNIANHTVSTGPVHLSNTNELDEHTELSYNYTETLSNMEPTPNEDGSFLSQTFQPPREHLQMQYMAGINKSSSYMMEHKHSIGRRLGQPDTGPPSVPSPTYCSKCTKMFATSEAYGCHEPMHLVNIKLFPCTECGKYYRQNTALVIHRRTHTGEKPYCCRECGRCFNARSSLVAHGKVHSRKKLNSCSECGKNFAKTDDLINHQLVHYRERKYICSDCGKCFKVEAELVAHRKIHPVEELFLCSVCGKDFTQYPKLLRHEKTHPKLPPVFITSERMLKDQDA